MADGRLRLEVHDGSSLLPASRDAARSAGGYGLQFVAALTDDWGWSTTPTGKCVWIRSVASPIRSPTTDSTRPTVRRRAPSPATCRQVLIPLSHSSTGSCHTRGGTDTRRDKETPMKAVRFQEPKGFEGIDGLVYEDAPDPQPAIGDALVQVRAASFTPTELMWPLVDRSRRARTGAAHPGPRGFGRRGRARLRRGRRVGRRRGLRPHRRLPRRLGRRAT